MLPAVATEPTWPTRSSSTPGWSVIATLVLSVAAGWLYAAVALGGRGWFW